MLCSVLLDRLRMVERAERRKANRGPAVTPKAKSRKMKEIERGSGGSTGRNHAAARLIAPTNTAAIVTAPANNSISSTEAYRQ